MKENLKHAARLALAVLVIGSLVKYQTNKNDIRGNSVMVMARSLDHGGTGIIYKSSKTQTEVLTNSHVCEVVKTGGVVATDNGTYQVNKYKQSISSDLCLLTISSNLGYNTKLASKAPKMYDNIKISGHPGLMPNIISTGHVSGDQILPVVTGMKTCTDEDIQKEPLLCVFLGGIPIIKYYESRLVSATIMPGSSGSGVYNKSDDLIGLVFAGSGGFGYGWTVPYEQVKEFLDNEQHKLEYTTVNNSMELRLNVQVKDLYREATQKCIKSDLTMLDATVKRVCGLLIRDSVWFK